MIGDTAPHTALDEVCSAAEQDAAAGAEARRLTPRVVDALASAGLFGLHLPRELNGLEASLPEACEVIRRVAQADGAAGWAVMIGAGPGWFAGHMNPELAREVFLGGAAVAGSGAAGDATPVPGGWRVSGRWRWCSGAPWASWLTLNALGDDGRAFTFAVPAAEARIDAATWDPPGLAATASCDVTLDEAVVPRRRTFVVDPAAPVRPEPVFRTPFLSFAQATMAAVSLGCAARAVEEFTRLARAKRPHGSAEALGESAAAREALGRAAAETGAARAYLERTVQRLWSAIASGHGADEAHAATELTLAACASAALGAGAVGALWERAGMSVLEPGSALRRALLDLRAASQNTVVAAARYADAGAALLDTAERPPTGAA
ncbi:MAG: acyl-CoA dehydrogenase family protein [Acidimicrobiales bacterium]